MGRCLEMTVWRFITKSKGSGEIGSRDKNFSETHNVSPYTSSVTKDWRSAFQAVCILRSTNGSASDQKESLWHIMKALRERCQRSTKLFYYG